MENLDFNSEYRLVRRSSYRYIFPPMIGMIFAQIAPVVDSVCVSNSGMGEEALSAIGIAGPLSYVFNMIAAFCGIGCGVIISRFSGTGEKAKAARAFTRALILLVISGLVLAAAGIVFIEPLLKLLCATPENYLYAKEYVTVILAGNVFIMLNFAGDYILANDNNENLAVAGDITGAVVNMIIDYAGVFLFHAGIWVVGLGTVIGSVCCCFVYLLHLRKKDRLCRIVSPVRKPDDPGLPEIIKPGSAEAIIYLFFTVQLLMQNYVLRDSLGVSGLGNSAIMENLTLILSILIGGCTDSIFPMASAFHGEQNRSGMLMVKRTLTRSGFLMLAVPIAAFCLFPQLYIGIYRIDDPMMLLTVPFAVRLVSLTQLIVFIDTLLIDYLSATEQEKKASLALGIQFAVQIPMILLLKSRAPENSPWYASLIAQTAVLVYLCFFCGGLTKGLYRFHRENLMALKGGRLTAALTADFEAAAEKILSSSQLVTFRQQMTEPLLAALSGEAAPDCCFSILKRDDGRSAVILRYEARKDLIEGLPRMDGADDEEASGDEEEVPPDTCISSEFLGMRRMMILFGEAENECSADPDELRSAKEPAQTAAGGQKERGSLWVILK